MSLIPQIKEHSLTVVGDINPAILQPSWLASRQLIRDAEAYEADIEVIHKEVTAFEIGWVKLHATTSRIQLSSQQEAYFEATRDLMVGILSVLEHIPVNALGLNWGTFYSFANRGEYDRFGHAIATKTCWDGLKEPKTLKVAITADRTDEFKGAVNVAVGPSDRLPLCAYVHVNDHFQIEGESPTTSSSAIERIDASWKHSSELTALVANGLFNGF